VSDFRAGWLEIRPRPRTTTMSPAGTALGSDQHARKANRSSKRAEAILVDVASSRDSGADGHSRSSGGRHEDASSAPSARLTARASQTRTNTGGGPLMWERIELPASVQPSSSYNGIL